MYVKRKDKIQPVLNKLNWIEICTQQYGIKASLTLKQKWNVVGRTLIHFLSWRLIPLLFLPDKYKTTACSCLA